MAKLGQAFKDKASDKAPKVVSGIRQKVANEISHLTNPEQVVVTAEGVKIPVSNVAEADTLYNAMGKNGNNHNKRPTFNDIKNEVSKNAKSTETGLSKKIIKPGPNGIYEDAPYHSTKGNSVKSARPINGQKALDNSVTYGKDARNRVGTSEGEIVVLSQTSKGEFHGHVRTWSELLSEGGNSANIISALRKNGFVSPKGNILK